MRQYKYIRSILLSILSVSVLLTTPTLAEPSRSDLVVRLSGCSSDAGKLKLALVNSKEQYHASKKGIAPYQGGHLQFEHGVASYRFQDIPFGDYALKVFHDENSNDKLNLNFFGLPKERYRFSNNARRKFGLPCYAEAKFTLSNQVLLVVVELE